MHSTDASFLVLVVPASNASPHLDPSCRNNQYSDGGHYGRAPWHRNKGGRLMGSALFVDVMYIHVLLNLMCSPMLNTDVAQGTRGDESAGTVAPPA